MTPDPRGVLAAFGLPGEPTAYAEVGGGWSNHVLRLTTTHGDYAVKELRNAWGEPRWLDWLVEGWRVESAAYGAGWRCPSPCPRPDGGCLAWVAPLDGGPEVPVRVHRWAESATVPREAVGTDLAHWVGGALATGAQPRARAAAARAVRRARRAHHGRGLAGPRGAVGRRAVGRRPRRSRAARPSGVRTAAAVGPGDAVLAHGDVDQKNLLLGPDGPLLIDWDVVLPAVPSHDLAHAALTMAAWSDPAVAAAVVRGYREAGGAIAALSPYDLGPALASRLGWVRFSVDRALDGSGPVPDLDALVADLRRRVEVAESLPTWLETAR